MSGGMRGLTIFISDIRNCTTKEAEQKRVDKELAHIRKQFADKSIDGYNTKKYTWKLLYMYMLGYDIEIGHMEALRLITSAKFTEKNTGYMACAILWNENTDFLRLLVQSIRKDLQPISEVNQCAALNFVANIGGLEFAESLAGDIQKLLLSGKSRSFVRKKSALTLLRLFRRNPECISQDEFAPKAVQLLDDPNIGVLTSVSSLLLGVVSHTTHGYEEVPDKVITLLTKLNFSKEKKSIYRYYFTLCPWLQVKCLRILQYFPPPADKTVMQRLNNVLNDILTKTQMTKNVNKNNADHAILFEAIDLIIHLCMHNSKELQNAAIGLLGRFISIRESNYRYLGLDSMTKLAHVPGALVNIKKHQEVIQSSLQDPDVSIRKRALDLLYVMCDKSNAKEIVDSLVVYLHTASFEMKEELVLKIAILAEKFAVDFRWYIDVILQLINLAGDFVTDDIWYRVVQIVTNNEDLQDYAATNCYKFLTAVNVHENGVKVGAYILGEFGDQIKDTALTGPVLFEVLQNKFKTSSNPTKALILSAYIKMANTYPELKQPINGVLDSHRSYVDAEIQQRACEYYVMNTSVDSKLMESVFDVMPNYTERESLLLKRIKKSQKATTDRDVWDEKDPNKEKEEEKKSKDDDDDSDDSDDSSSDDSSSDDSSSDDSSSDDSSDSDDSDSDSEKKPKPARGTQSGTLDILSGLSSSNMSTASNVVNNSSSVNLFPPQNPAALHALYAKDSGVLYESSALQIGMKSTVENQNSIKLVFYYGNKLPNTIKDVSVSPSESDAYKIQVRPTEPFEVPPKKQVLHYFLIHCFKPFKDPLSVELSFNYLNKPHTLQLTIPVLLHTFIVPTTLESAAFIAAWAKYGNEIIVTRKSIDGSNYDCEQLKQLITSTAHLFIVPDVEKTSDNFVAAGTFHTATKNAAGSNVTMPCLIRVETKPNVSMFRLTVHSGHSSVSEALVAMITTLLKAKE